VFSPEELNVLADRGAVGDICLRFFDRAGRQVITGLNDRVISMELEQLRKVRRVIGIAGGRRKTMAIRGALTGKLVNALITDLTCARQLIAESAR
jgi:DNA-binding transcriptional regulator LsrR (DeoR family)